MPICTFSNDYDSKNHTIIENRFITDYLPVLDEKEIKVYIFGLYLCNDVYGANNNLDGFCKGTGLTPYEIKKSLNKLQSVGLITIASTAPLQLRFNSPNKAVPATRKYNADKYSDFILTVQQLFVDKELTQNDLYAFVDFIEETKMEQSAFIVIAQYCLDLKGKNLNRNYLITVARSWANDGCLSFSDVENRLQKIEATTDDIRQILHALKSKRAIDVDDRELYINWQKLGFDLESILVAAKQVKRGGMAKLDELLQNYSKEGIFDKEDIKAYADLKNQIYDCTYKVIKNLGLYYEDCSAIADECISIWFKKGFTSQGLQKIARYCRLCSIRDVAGFDKMVQDFYRDGYVSDHSIDLQLDALTRFNETVQQIIYATGSTRKVTQQDRDNYRTWSVLWGIPDDVIFKYAVESQGKASTMAWISNRLAEIKGNNSFVNDATEPVLSKRAEKHGLSDFERAEIRDKLLDDSIYARLTLQKKKLDFDMSGYLFNSKAVPLVIQQEYDSLVAQINDRIKELGYNPEDLK